MLNVDQLDMLLTLVPEAKPQEAHLDDAVLMAYRRGDADEVRMAEVEAHLASCADCRALLVALPDEPSSTLEEWASTAGGATMVSRASKRLPGWIAATGALAAAAAAAAALVLLVLPSGNRESPWPNYGLSGLEGVVQTRTVGSVPSNGATVFSARSLVEVAITPDTPRRSRPTPKLTVFLETVEGRMSVLPERYTEVTESGVFLFEASAFTIFPEPGSYVLHFVLHPAEQSLSIDTSARLASLAIRTLQWHGSVRYQP